MTNPHPVSHATTWQQFRKNKAAWISCLILAVTLVIALIAPFLANEKPWYANYENENYFPAFSFRQTIEMTNPLTEKKQMIPYGQVEWKKLKLKKVIWAPVPFSPGISDQENSDYQAPSKQHVLGTTKNGADVFSGLIHGSRISLSIGILSMLIASLIGISLGSLAGYFGDHQLKIKRGNLWTMVIGILPAYFYAFYVRSNELSELFENPGIVSCLNLLFSLSIFFCILFCFYQAGHFLNRFSFFSKNLFLHIDSMISRITEIFVSIPRLVLIISIAAIARPSFFHLLLIIGLTSWTEISRFTRAELLRIRNSDYTQSARAMGFTNAHIILKHALPNALAPASVAIVFGIASAILIESGLSFLGVGVPQDVVTWGSLLFAGKENFEAWWLVIFPGLAIFITITALNIAGDGLRDAMDVKSRKY